jgi:hypothetical protein
MKTCFVVMGFNRKTDYQSGRTLDLDKSYRLLIEPAVQEAGLECVRADRIIHSGVLDVPMYEYLLESDLVIADLSTSNPNALYELGVRHALRPFSTLVIAESRLQYPFNVAHTAIRSYEHLGDAIDYEEVIRFRNELKQAIAAVLARQERDSPVYTYLPALRPPSLGGGRGGGRETVTRGAATSSALPALPELIERASSALEQGDFSTARTLLAEAHAMRPADRPWTSDDDYLVQQLAFSTLMTRTPGSTTAAAEAHRLLTALAPHTSNDPATVELWGRIATAMWDDTHQPAHMEDAVSAYERTFCLRNDIDSGTTLAFLLNARATISDPAGAIADFVQARRVRHRILQLGEAALAAERAPSRPAGGGGPDADEHERARRYRLRAALAEAHAGLGNPAESKRWEQEALELDVPLKLREETIRRLASLRTLLAQSPLRFLAL